MQCEAGTSYQPCVSTCPPKTCHNLQNYNKISLACSQEPCMEGCAPQTCHQGDVFEDDDHVKCINSLNCKVKCLKENGTQYYEGDIMEKTDSQSW